MTNDTLRARQVAKGLSVERPEPIPPAQAGRERLGGWLDQQGRFYASDQWQHLEIARRLRLTGDGPADPWMPERSSWILVKSYGEAVAMPFRTSQAQWDSLGEILTHAPEDSSYQHYLRVSLRQLQSLECR